MKTEKKLESFFNLTMEMMVTLTKDGTIEKISPSVKTILGYN
jgi:hypothetical protein